MDIWEAYMKHPFIVELQEETLDIERFNFHVCLVIAILRGIMHRILIKI